LVQPVATVPPEGVAGPLLLSRVGSHMCAVAAAHIVETMRLLPIHPIVSKWAFVLGVSVVRGVPVPVLDTAILLAATGRSSPERFVALRVGSRTAVLAVDAVLGIRSIEGDALVKLPPLLRDAESAVIEAIATLDSELLVVLKCARIVPPEVWASLDSAGRQ
jgi:purine-binding chemotaxis protein CheW